MGSSIPEQDEFDQTVQNLLNIIVEDLLKSGVMEKEAGWRNPQEIGLNSAILEELSRLEIIENRRSGEIRLKFNSQATQKKLFKYKRRFEQIKYLLESRDLMVEDQARLERSIEILNYLKTQIEQNQNLLPPLVAIGIWKMLKVSEMSARVDDILEGGFSPKNWAIASQRAISTLSINIAKKVGDIENWESAFQIVRKANLLRNFQNLVSNSNNEIEKVKYIINWETISDHLSETDVKLLGLSWFTILLLEETNSLPLSVDLSPQFLDQIKNCIEEVLKKDWRSLINSLESALIKLEDQNITWSRNILFLPEVV